ncbi:hypothetical protein LIP_0334 [Limnochorda pilosa]|uniref:Uncharacterized protein n=1 Tax=Limnochorda pilosa TaxID=1555112 RepID=A0A0K2SGG4_LIMPI|nr:hypothetical protein LIP_0334 [Limnochorda pilosa]
MQGDGSLYPSRAVLDAPGAATHARLGVGLAWKELHLRVAKFLRRGKLLGSLPAQPEEVRAWLAASR